MNDIFVERLIELRKEGNMCQCDLAKAIGTTQAAVSLWERGERTPDIDTLLKLANVFNVSTDYLLGREDI